MYCDDLSVWCEMCLWNEFEEMIVYVVKLSVEIERFGDIVKKLDDEFMMVCEVVKWFIEENNLFINCVDVVEKKNEIYFFFGATSAKYEDLELF